jgi:glucose-1-phosphate adenylyltransferase
MKNSLSKDALAVILGGGAGSRLFPLTQTRSKPAVPIAGQYRLVDIPISNCINSEIGRMFVLTQFNSASLNSHVKNTYHFSIFSSAFVEIIAAEQTPDSQAWFQGTADAVRQSLKHFNQYDFKYMIILSGDQLYQMDLNEFLENHILNNADISIATTPVNAHDATDFGIMKKKEDGFISAFIEKPDKEDLSNWQSNTGPAMQSVGKNYLASMGIYIFNKEILYRLLQEECAQSTDFGKEIIPYSIDKLKVISYQYNGYWTDIGNISSFFEANLALTDEVPAFNLFDSTNPIYTRARMLPSSKIDGSHILRSMIADGSIVHASRIDRSIVGIRTRIGRDSEIIGSYIMGNDYFETIEDINRSANTTTPIMGIGERCYIKNAIIDKNCRIGNDVKIIGSERLPDQDTVLFTIKNGIVVIKKGAIIPHGFVIGKS